MALKNTTLDRWYAVSVVSGNEQAVAKRINERLAKVPGVPRDLEIVTPNEEVIIGAGTDDRQVIRRHSMPGYILVRCRFLSPIVASTIVRVQGVMGFIGGAEKPTPLTGSEIDRILKSQGHAAPKSPSAKAGFAPGQTVKVIDGPLTDFEGQIVSINAAAQTAQLEVTIFGRNTKAQIKLSALRKV